MELFLVLLRQVVPLGLPIFLGYFAQKRWDLHAPSISKFLIFCVAPVVFLNGGWSIQLDAGALISPFLFFGVEAGVGLIFFWLGSRLFKDRTGNLWAFSGVDPNTGYFGYPVVVALLGAGLGPLAIVVNMGSMFYQNILAYYFLARGQYSVSESLGRLIRLPALYAYGLGLILQFLNVKPMESLQPLIQYFTGAWVILGMAIVGMGLARVKLENLDFKFLSLSFLGKFAVVPLVTLGLFWVDAHTLQLLDANVRSVFWILMLGPTAANTVAYSTELNVHPDKAASMVFLSTVFALIYIPFILSLGLQ